MIQLEVCANSVQSCIEAEKAGATRVELCDNLKDGGTTPSYSQIELAKANINIAINVIIRPRGGDFLYTEIEFESMKKDILHCAQAGVNGVVFGILDRYGNIDIERTQVLEKLARQNELSTTFHRAIDRSNNLEKAMEEIINIGCDRILTSGGKKNALEGKEKIKQLIEKAKDRIIIMPGGGITENNIQELVKHTNLKEFHGSFQTNIKGNMDYTKKEDELGIFEEEYYHMQSCKARIEQALRYANGQ